MVRDLAKSFIDSYSDLGVLMKVVQGDLIAMAQRGDFDVIVHGCNCQCAMGAGIAKTIKRVFPQAYAADKRTPQGDASKLGTFSAATVETEAGDLVVVNAYTQEHWRRHGSPPIDYSALESAFRAVKDAFSGKRIAYPRIGAGLAGGDWQRISAIIDRVLQGEDHTLVEYRP